MNISGACHTIHGVDLHFGITFPSTLAIYIHDIHIIYIPCIHT